MSEANLPSFQRVRFIIVGIVALVTVRMIIAAQEHQQWREFLVSEAGVVAAMGVLLIVLRPRDSSTHSSDV